MNHDADFALRINAYTPETIPMERLARYMLDFAGLMGSANRVHFTKVRKGSTRILARVEAEDVPKVASRLATARRPDAPAEITKYVRNINTLLREDAATATLKQGSTNVYEFPGAKEPPSRRIGPIREAGVLEGEIVRVGGRDRTIHILLIGPDDQEYRLVTSSRDTAKRIATHLFCPVRVTGTGTWTRDEGGNWELENFIVEDFHPTDERSLIEAFAALQAADGSEWKKMNDPLAAWQALRSH